MIGTCEMFAEASEQQGKGSDLKDHSKSRSHSAAMVVERRIVADVAVAVAMKVEKEEVCIGPTCPSRLKYSGRGASPVWSLAAEDRFPPCCTSTGSRNVGAGESGSDVY